MGGTIAAANSIPYQVNKGSDDYICVQWHRILPNSALPLLEIERERERERIWITEKKNAPEYLIFEWLKCVS